MEKYTNLSIVISDVTKEYSLRKGIYQVNTTFESGKLNLITGENGSGKSTLLRCIMGLVSYQGNIIKRRIKIGYAPEEFIMPLNMSVLDFLMSIGRIKGCERDNLNDNLDYYLSFFDMEGYKYKLIKTLSHGTRQKVNLIQAFVHNPKIIILDEPLGGLDKEIIPRLIKLIKELSKEKIVIVSTHNSGRFNFKNKRIYEFKEGRLYLE